MIPIHILLIILALISVFFLFIFAMIQDKRTDKEIEDNINNYCDIYKEEIKFLKRKIKKLHKEIEYLEKN